MKNYGLAALGAALVFACGVIAWMGYQRLGTPRSSAPAPVQALTAAPIPSPSARASAGPIPARSAAPVVFASPAPTPTPVSAPRAAVPAASAAPEATGAPATAEPLEAASASPSGAPMPLVTLHPGATAPGVVREPADAPPRILSLALSTPVAHGGDVVSGYVETTSNVASVEARIAGYSSAMRKIGVGKFVMSYKVPNLPFFLHRTYTIQVIARNTRGDAVTGSLPITIR